MTSATTPQIAARRGLPGWAMLVAVFGPGLVVMLADTDVGSIITAGQSGVQWGYKLLLPQFILMPVLYIVQELTVRLGIFTGKGHGELIREAFGPGWAWFSASGLAVATIGALLTEFSGVAGVGDLFGIPHYRLAAARCRGLARHRRHRLLPPRRACRHHHRAVRTGVFLRCLGGASRCRADGQRVAAPAGVQCQLRISRRRQYRRGDHALDGVLPAIRRGG